MIKRATLLTILAVSAVAAGDPRPSKKPAGKSGGRLEPDDLPGPQPEVAKEKAKLDLPAIPGFELPAVEAGVHSPRELRVRGQRALGTEVQVRGYVTWIYNCAEALAASNRNASQAQIAAAIQKDPALCDRPKFSIGDSKTTSRKASLWVVDVPRPPTKAELAARTKSDAALPEVPRVALGDYVVVTGTWALYSPHAEHNTDGLLVYKSLERTAAPPAPAAKQAMAVAEPEIDVVAKAPMRTPVGESTRNASIDQLNACNKANAARQFEAAITACQAAIKAWPGNHLAWYALASAHMARNEWPMARDAVEHAVKLRPDVGMYQLYHGISLYEAERERVRDEPGLLKLDAARDALRRAARLGPDLWRAHYYLGRVYRDLDDAQHEAEQFSATITTHPSYRFGYIALIELYRKWNYVDQALAIAQLGTANVPAAESPELWFEVGMAYDAKRDDDKAIEAFGKAIAGKPGDLGSKFQRGQIYFRKGDFANAKRDLDEVARSTDPSIAGVKPLATQMLGQIARKQR